MPIDSIRHYRYVDRANRYAEELLELQSSYYKCDSLQDEIHEMQKMLRDRQEGKVIDGDAIQTQLNIIRLQQNIVNRLHHHIKQEQLIG